MEAALEHDDHLRARRGANRFLLAAGIQARQLDGALVRLGPGVGEERLPRLGISFFGTCVQQIGKLLCQLSATLDVVVVAHVNELGSLPVECFHKRWMAMSEADDADAAQEIEVLLALIVPKAHAFAAHELDRLTAERVHDVGFLELFLLF